MHSVEREVERMSCDEMRSVKREEDRMR
jgi:hypothetical protein